MAIPVEEAIAALSTFSLEVCVATSSIPFRSEISYFISRLYLYIQSVLVFLDLFSFGLEEIED